VYDFCGPRFSHILMTVVLLMYSLRLTPQRRTFSSLFFVEWGGGAYLHNSTWLFLFTSVHVHPVVPASFFPPWTSLTTLSWYRLFLVAMEAGYCCIASTVLTALLSHAAFCRMVLYVLA